MKEEQQIDLLAELYDTYTDLSSGKLTLTRIYVLMCICGLVIFGLLGVSMLFAVRFAIAGVYFSCAALCYLLLRFRRRRFVAVHFDWLSVILCHVLTLIAVAINVYLYGNASGSQIFIFAMVAIFYIISLDIFRKRFWGILAVFLIDLIGFWLISLMDFYLPSTREDEAFFAATFIVSSLLGLGVCIAPVLISKLYSIDAIEQLNYIQQRKSAFEAEEFYGCISRRAADYAVAKSDGQEFRELNICIVELLCGEDGQTPYLSSDFYFSRLVKELATLLRAYFSCAHFIIRLDANTFAVIFQASERNAYKIILNMKNAFNQKIRPENPTINAYLRIVARHYELLDTTRRARKLLECVSELSRAKYDAKVLGNEYFCMQTSKLNEFDDEFFKI